MKYAVVISRDLEKKLREHLFQNELEQGAFLFAQPVISADEISLVANDVYLVQPEDWQVQHQVYLELKDSARAKIMQLARQRDLAIVDIHSHPGSNGDVSFSPSDRHGITDFAQYAKWKLGAKPYLAMVWGEASLDAVIWHDLFDKANQVNEVRILGRLRTRIITPKATWNRKTEWFGSMRSYE